MCPCNALFSTNGTLLKAWWKWPVCWAHWLTEHLELNWHRLKYKMKYSSVSVASILFELSLVTVLSNCCVVTAFWPGTEEFRCSQYLKRWCKLWVVMSVRAWIGISSVLLYMDAPDFSAAICSFRSNFKLLAVSGKLYAIGGQSLSNVECYNPENDWWNFVASMPNPLAEFSACECKGKIYVIGGYTARGNKFGVISCCFLPDWSEGPDNFLLFFRKVFELM